MLVSRNRKLSFEIHLDLLFAGFPGLILQWTKAMSPLEWPVRNVEAAVKKKEDAVISRIISVKFLCIYTM